MCQRDEELSKYVDCKSFLDKISRFIAELLSSHEVCMNCESVATPPCGINVNMHSGEMGMKTSY